MGNLNRQDFEVVGKIIKSGALRCDINNLCNVLESYQNRFRPCEDDDETTKVFKNYVIFGNAEEVSRTTGVKPDKVRDILFYKTCEDFELTLMAKYIYSVSGTKYNSFLKRQVDIMFREGSINVKQEYLKWKLEAHEDKTNAGHISIDDIKMSIENIDFD